MKAISTDDYVANGSGGTAPRSGLFVCRTCVRDTVLAPDEQSMGGAIASRIRALLGESTLGNDLRFRAVTCLNGCVNPCNAAFRGRDKFNFRFGGLVPGDEQAIVQFASSYVQNDRGDVPREAWPDLLKKKLTSCIEPFGAAASDLTSS